MATSDLLLPEEEYIVPVPLPLEVEYIVPVPLPLEVEYIVPVPPEEEYIVPVPPEEEEDPLKCRTCREIYTDPVTLHCGDTFCRGCVGGKFSKHQQDTCYICAICSERTFLRKWKVLPTNKALSRQCEKVKQECHKCVSCQRIMREGGKPCQDCLSPLCDKCELTHNCPSKKAKCEKENHQEELNYFCKTCGILCCSKCLLGVEHRDHETEAAVSAFNKAYSLLKAGSQNLTERHIALKDKLQESEGVAAEIQIQIENEIKGLQSLESWICSQFIAAYKKLETQKSSVAEEVKEDRLKIKNIRLGGLNKNVKSLADVVQIDAGKAYSDCVQVTDMCERWSNYLTGLEGQSITAEEAGIVNAYICNVKGHFRETLFARINTSLPSSRTFVDGSDIQRLPKLGKAKISSKGCLKKY